MGILRFSLGCATFFPFVGSSSRRDICLDLRNALVMCQTVGEVKSNLLNILVSSEFCIRIILGAMYSLIGGN